MPRGITAIKQRPTAAGIVSALPCTNPSCPCQRAVEKGEGTTHCPAHTDDTPSLSVTQDGTKVLVKCHAQCSQAEVINALHDLDLWPTPWRVDEHVYRDEQGEPVRTTKRIDTGNGKQVWQEQPDGTKNVKGVRSLPYRLPELMEADPKRVVFVVEGEKDADRLASLGLVATTNPGGASKWRDELSQHLRDRKVVILPDNDDAGRKHAQQVACSVYPVAARVQLLELPDLPPTGDVSDWLDAGRTKEELVALAKATANWQPTSPLVITSLADVKREEVQWRWTNRLPASKLVLLEGDPGTGKSWTSLAIATAITTGALLPGDTERHEPRRVLLLTAEDGLADTVRPRMEDMHADLSRVDVLEAVNDGQGHERHPSLVDDVHLIEEHVARRGDYALVIIDPINAYLGATDTYKDSALRAVLAPWAAMAEQQRLIVLPILHLTKSARDRAIYRGQGSIAYAAAARVVMLAGVNPTNPHERVLSWVKNNLAPPAPSLLFEIQAGGRFRWGDETDVTPAALLAPDEQEDGSVLKEAEALLNALLADGPMPAKEAKREAREAGVSERSLIRAKEKLGITSNKRGMYGPWYWSLASHDSKATEAPPEFRDHDF